MAFIFSPISLELSVFCDWGDFSWRFQLLIEVHFLKGSLLAVYPLFKVVQLV
jgi:hypothetical protein